MQKYISPTLSIVIVLAVFCLALFTVLQGEASLNKQLTASISGSVKDKALDMAEMSECVGKAYNIFLTKWNQECKGLGLEDKCDLPRSIADSLKSEYADSQKTCY